MKTFTAYKTGLPLMAGALFFAIVTTPATAGFAQSQPNGTQLMNRIEQLENQIQTLSRAVYRGEKIPAPVDMGSTGGSDSAIASFEVRLSQIETQQRAMTGQIEQVSFDVQQMKSKVDKMIADNELRFQQVEGKGGVAPSSSAPSTPELKGDLYADESAGGKLPAGTLGTLSETGAGNADPASALYETAFADIRAAKYDGAETKFKKFMEAYPNHALAANAQYWLAETYYVRGDYTQSAKMFAQGYQDYPEGQKAADSLLKLGLSLGKLGKKEDACLSLQQLKKQFPGDQSTVVSRATQEMKQLGCK